MDEFYSNCKFYNENNNLLGDFERRVEEGSRYLVNKYVKPNMKVLELGARYGTVSICLDYILDDPKTQLLCVDPDVTIIDCLNKNREINNGTFHIFNGAISSNELYACYNGCVWETKTYINPPPHLKHIKIPTMTLDEVQQKYNIYFDCLLADCEGFLLQFMQENEGFFNNLRCVIYEEDCGKNHPINGTYIDYEIVEIFLKSKGFVLLETYVDFIGLSNKIWIKY